MALASMRRFSLIDGCFAFLQGCQNTLTRDSMSTPAAVPDNGLPPGSAIALAFAIDKQDDMFAVLAQKDGPVTIYGDKPPRLTRIKNSLNSLFQSVAKHTTSSVHRFEIYPDSQDTGFFYL